MLGVLLVGDVKLYMQGIQFLLEGNTLVCVKGVAFSSDLIVDKVAKSHIDIILIDINMEDCMETIKSIKQSHPNIKIVILGIKKSDPELTYCLNAGVDGYTSRDCEIEDLIKCITATYKGEFLCTPKIAGQMLQRLKKINSISRNYHSKSLTTREFDVVKLIDAGLTNKQIARELHIEVSTVKNHVHRILKKLNIKRRNDTASALSEAS